MICVYHKSDLDGIMSAAIVAYAVKTGKYLGIESPINFIGWNYGEEIPQEVYDDVSLFMVDISFPANIMLKLNKHYRAKRGLFVWIDHHISTMNQVKEVFDNAMELHPLGLRTTDKAACELVWKYFFERDRIYFPTLVYYLGVYDSYRFVRELTAEDQKKVLEIQYGARDLIQTVDDALTFLESSIVFDNVQSHNDVMDVIHEAGKPIYKYLKRRYEDLITYSHDLTFVIGDEDHGITTVKFHAINELVNPKNFGLVPNDGYAGFAVFTLNNDMKWKFTLYSDIVDCSIIASSFGGGGHKGAAGFIASNDFFQQFINHRTITAY